MQCHLCKAFLTYNSVKTGTSHLNGHKCKVSSHYGNIEPYFAKKGSVIPAGVRETVADVCVHLCAKDIQPFDAVSGDGFVDIANVLISFGVHCGRVDARTVLPYPTTISRRVAQVAESL